MKYYQDNHATIYNGDCRSMTELPDESVQCVVTSPPYWGLRKYTGEQDLIWGGDKNCKHEWAGAGLISDVRKDKILAGKSRTEERFYGGDETRKFNGQHQKHYQDNTCSLCGAWKGAYGLEPTPEMYIQHTVEIMREIRRVLRKDGCVFWNIGDSYAGSGGANENKERGGVVENPNRKPQSAITGMEPVTWEENGKPKKKGMTRVGAVKGLKPKDLCLIPFRVAISLQNDGWWVRSDIIWSKNNPMPESVTDRPTNSHEYIFLFTKSSKYYWDADAVREQSVDDYETWLHKRGNNPKYQESNLKANHAATSTYNPSGRNIRSVWEFPTQPYPECHFAVFPEKLPEICIKAGTPEAGCCSKCGKPWVRITEQVKTDTRPGRNTGLGKSGTDDDPNQSLHQSDLSKYRQQIGVNTLGWKPSCKCNADKVPSLVLDPFMGAGTTLWVAKKLNRRAVGYEISEEYCRLALERNRQGVLGI